MIAAQESAVHGHSYESHHIDAGLRTTDELVRIAAAAASRGAPVTFRGLGSRPLGDLMKIVAAGGRWEGRVATIAAPRCQDDAHHRVSVADALLPGFLLSRFLCLPSSTVTVAARAQW